MTQNIRVASREEKALTSGRAFVVAERSAGVASAGVLELLIRAPASGQVRATLRGSATGEAHTDLFEGPTVSVDGTAVSRVNRNRTGTPQASGVLAFTGPTTSADGTSLFKEILGGQFAGGEERILEFKLKPGTDYLLRVTNDDASAQDLAVEARWFEE